MSPGRYVHTAVRLSDDRVLVLGGLGQSSDGGPDFVWTTSQVWDPLTGTWHHTRNHPGVSTWVSATLLRDGRVLIIRGDGAADPFESPVLLFDPDTETWTEGPGVARLGAWHAAVVLQDGSVLIVGDWIFDGSLESPWAALLDPTSGAWRPVQAPGGPRFGAALCALPDGSVLVAGGGMPPAITASAERFDPLAGSWHPTGPLLQARSRSPALLLPSGQVIFGGFPTELYDPTSGTWTMAAGAGFDGNAATLLADGRILVAGSGTGLSDPVRGTLQPITEDYPYGHSVTALSDGRALVVGGMVPGPGGVDDPVPSAQAHVYDLATGALTRTGDLQP